MPAGNLTRVSPSLTRNGTCLSNLRGANPVYDYVAPSRSFSIGPALSTISTIGTAGADTWANTIQRSYYSTDSEQSAVISYPSLLSATTTGTILIRLYIQAHTGGNIPPIVQPVFQNGTGATNGYSIFLTAYDNLKGGYEYNLWFGRNQDLSADWVPLAPKAAPVVGGEEEGGGLTPGGGEEEGGGMLPGGGEEEGGGMLPGGGEAVSVIQTDQWLQFSITFLSDSGSTTVRSYLSGSGPTEQIIPNEITTPTGGTELMNFFGRVTDFAFFNVQLADSLLIAYGTAPYI